MKNPDAKQHGQVYFHDIGDYLNREEKLGIISGFSSIAGITEADGWHPVVSDVHGDWLKQRDDSFNEYIALGDKKGDSAKLFENFSLGVVTNRDAWCYNASKAGVEANMTRMISFYNGESARFNETHMSVDRRERAAKVDDFIVTDASQISWTGSLKQELAKSRSFAFKASCLTPAYIGP